MKSLVPDIHVLPVDDLKDHIESRDCWCNPRLEDVSVFGEEMGSRVMIVHPSMDGRELIEEHGIQ